MDFIDAKEFLKQSEKVQKVFLDWWKPERYELVQGCYYGKEYDNKRIWRIGDVDMHYVKNELKPIPLFMEGQLRKFIEDKTNCYIEIIVGLSGYIFVLRSKETLKEVKRTSISKRDLLKAYWQVAIKTAEEETKEME